MNKNSGLSKFSKAEQQQIALDFFKSMTDKNESGKVRGFCHEFTVHVNIGIFEVETSLTMCCTTLTMNCHPVPKHIIHRSASDPDIKAFEVTSSSIYTDEDGNKVKIKEGIYEVAADDTVQFEIVEVK